MIRLYNSSDGSPYGWVKTAQEGWQEFAVALRHSLRLVQQPVLPRRSATS